VIKHIKIAALIFVIAAILQCTVFSEEQNIAYQKKVTASSVYSDSFAAQNIVDDNASTGWSPGNGDNMSYVTIDLGEEYIVSRVEVVPRVGYDQKDTRRNFKITGDVYDSFEDPVLIGECGQEPFGATEVFKCEVTSNTPLRYIRIEKTVAEYFYIGDVRVYGTPVNESVKEIPQYPDILDTEYEEAVDFISALGITDRMSGEDYSPENKLTRAEAAVLFTKACGNNPIDTSCKRKYKDVPQSYWAYDAINAIVNLGYMGNVENSKFMPDEVLTYGQAKAISVMMLGYEQEAQSNGGWLNGYNVIALRLKLIKGITYAQDSDPITRGNFAKLIYNMLDSEFLQFSGDIKNGSVTYVKSQDTLLYNNFNCKLIEGIITENSYSSLDKSGGRKNAIVINGAEYKNTSRLYDDYLGYYVKAIVDETDKDDPELLMLKPGNKNKTLSIQADDLEPDDSRFGRRYIVYNEADRRIKTIRLDDMVSVLYNGVAFTDYVTDDMKIKNGELCLIDNNGDGKYEVLDIRAMKVMLISAVKVISSETVFYDRYNNSFSIDRSTCDDIEYVNENGNADYGDVAENTIVGIYASKDLSRVKVKIAGTVLQSKVVRIDEDEYILDDGNGYEIYSEYLSDINLNIGDTGTFYISENGKITGVDYEAGIYRYAYLTRVYYDDDEEKIHLEFINDSGEFENATVNKKPIINGESVLTENFLDEIKKTGRKMNGDANDLTQPIKYSINSQKEVKKIITEGDYSGIDEKDRLIALNGAASLYRSARFSSGNLFWYTGTQSVKITDKTKIFSAPPDNNDSSIVKTKSYYKVMKTTDLLNGNDYNIRVYASSEVEGADLVIVYKKKVGSLDQSSRAMLIKKTYTTINEDDELTIGLVGYSGKSELELVMDDDERETLEPLIKKYAVVRYRAEEGKLVSASQLIPDITTEELNFKSVTYGGDMPPGASIIYGRLIDKKGNNTIISTSLDDITSTAFADVSGAAVYKCNGDNIESISNNDLANYLYKINRRAEVIYFASYGNVYMVIVRD